MKIIKTLALLLIFCLEVIGQKSNYIFRPNSKFRLFYNDDKVVDGKKQDYTHYVDIQTDKKGNVVGWVNFTDKSGIIFSKERWDKIDKTNYENNIISEIKFLDPQNGALKIHAIFQNLDQLPYGEFSKKICGYIYNYEGGNLINFQQMYNGESIINIDYGQNGIKKLEQLKTFENNYYWESILFDVNGQSYKILKDDLNEPQWINWNYNSDNLISYNKDGLNVIGTREHGASIFKELPYSSKNNHSISLGLKRLSGKDFAGLIFGAQAGGVRNFWHFGISSTGFYQILNVANGTIMPVNLKSDRFDELPKKYVNEETKRLSMRKDYSVGFSNYINTGEDATNTIDIKRIGEKIIFSINGHIVEELENTYIYGTGTGFLIAKNSPNSPINKVAFSNMLITEYSPELPSWLEQTPQKSENLMSTGTGFLVSNEGLICTNFHVVKGAKNIIVNIGGEKIPAAVIVADENSDLAILKLSQNKTVNKVIPFGVEDYNPMLGDNIFVLGFPASDILGTSIKLTNGVISSKKGYNDDLKTFQISAAVHPGSSGSPLFNDKGNLIGVVNSGVPGLSNVGYAIKTNYLLSLMKKAGIVPTLLVKNNTKKDLPSMVEITSKFIFIIEVEL